MFVKLTGEVNHYFRDSYFATCRVLLSERTSDFRVFLEQVHQVLFIASSALSVKMLPVVDFILFFT